MKLYHFLYNNNNEQENLSKIIFEISFKNSCIKFDTFQDNTTQLIFIPKGSSQERKC